MAGLLANIRSRTANQEKHDLVPIHFTDKQIPPEKDRILNLVRAIFVNFICLIMCTYIVDSIHPNELESGSADGTKQAGTHYLRTKEIFINKASFLGLTSEKLDNCELHRSWQKRRVILTTEFLSFAFEGKVFLPSFFFKQI